ncbi:hypothetical protein [Shouchella shacheensis]|uniref:hypothetical protein n=1 Tax=Shouchella shacheensis TaxID=1649580 RepID=UPI00073FB064|nr:hypothetical protein [Shouchella shacheensis]
MNNKSNIPMNPHQVQGEYQPMGEDVKQQCQRYMNYHVIAQTSEGLQFDGIIDGMDEEGVTMLVPEEVMEEGNRQQYGYDDDYDEYGRPRRRRYRRYRRRRWPYYYFRYFWPYPYYLW